MNSPQTIEFSLTQGGPFYRLMSKLHVLRNDDSDPLRKSLAIILVTWLPLEVFALIDYRLSGVAQFFSFWTVVSVHVRFLVAIPMLFVAERVLDRCCRSAMVCFSEGGFVRGAHEEIVTLVRAAERSRDSTSVEVFLFLGIVVGHLSNFLITGNVALIHDYPEHRAPELGMVWYGLVSLPIFSFLFVRVLRQWWIWATLLWSLSRLDLRLIPTHPDRAGGIGHMAEPTYGIALVLAACSCVMAASWGSFVYFGKIQPIAFAFQLGALIVLGLFVSIGPLVPFSSALLRARLEGSDPYSGLAATYTRLFERRWVDTRDQKGLLEANDVSGLADLISSYKSLEELRVLPIGKEQLLTVVVAVIVPMLPLPLLASEIPVSELFGRLFKNLLLGG